MANGSWKIARSRGYAQLPLGIVVVLVLVVLLLGKAQSVVFDRARASVADFMAPALETVRGPLAGLNRWMGSIGGIFVVYQENLRLKEENARLRQWRNTAIVLQDRVQRYQLMLHAVPDPELSTVLARVIGRASRPFLETMILDAGKTNNVKPGQAVVDARGMIGRIFISGQRTSWVILLTDLNSRVPVTIEPGNVQAIMSGDNTATPAVDLTAQNAHIKPGDQVVSSGDGSLLPPGIPIGTIVGNEGAFRVVLLADASSSQDVDILDYKRPPEESPTPGPKDLPATAAGLPPAAAPQPAPAVPGQVPAGTVSTNAVPKAKPGDVTATGARTPATTNGAPVTRVAHRASAAPDASNGSSPNAAPDNSSPDDSNNQ